MKIAIIDLFFIFDTGCVLILQGSNTGREEKEEIKLR